MNIENINSVTDIETYIEGCMNDFESGISDKQEIINNMCKLVSHLLLKVDIEKYKDSIRELLKVYVVEIDEDGNPTTPLAIMIEVVNKAQMLLNQPPVKL